MDGALRAGPNFFRTCEIESGTLLKTKVGLHQNLFEVHKRFGPYLARSCSTYGWRGTKTVPLEQLHSLAVMSGVKLSVITSVVT